MRRKSVLPSIWLMLTTVLLIIGALLAWFSWADYESTQASEYRLLEAHARNTEAQVTVALDDISQLLSQIAEQRLAEGSAPASKFQAALTRHLSASPAIGTLLVTDASGRVVLATNPSMKGIDTSKQAWFTAHLDRTRAPKLHVSRPDKSLLDTNVITVTLPIVDARRGFLGVVGATVDYSWFTHVLKSVHPDDSGSVTVLFNGDGDIVYRRFDPEKFFGSNMVNVSKVFREHVASGQRVSRHIGPSQANGKTRVFLVRRLGDTGFSVILSRQLDEVLAGWLRNLVVNALIFTLVAAVMLPLAWVSERRQREVLAAKAFTDKLIATASVMLVGLDAAGRVTIFNQAAERVCGYRRDEVLGKNWFELVVPRTHMAQVSTAFHQFRQTGDMPHAFDYPILTRAGTEHLISWQSSTVRDQADMSTLIFFGIDVTERRQAEDEQKRFVAMISHEFRTPLATIDGAVQHLEMHAHNVDEATRRRYVKIQKSVDRLTKLLDDYLIQEQLDRVAHGLRVVSVAPLTLLEDCRASALALSTEHIVTVEQSEIPDAVLCDPDLMRLTLRILADNAVKYTAPGSTIQLSSRHADRNGIDGVALLVSDNGAGIDEAELPQVFEKFFRGRSAARETGSGIGLHLARSVVESHGGSLTARNLPTGGAAFTIWLPTGVANEIKQAPAPVRIG
ncbi:sensor histidine kinase [Noviherbaspirillum cavernae]|nr:ATP-binding protein [Noviherbaspirillum cavernae]